MADETLAGLGLSLATYIGSTAVGGIIERISGDAVLGSWSKLRENLKKYCPDGNHEIQEAVLRSYLQATLQICVVYGEDVGISVNQCVFRELLPRFFAKAEVLSHKLTNSNQLPENAEELYRRQFRELPENIKTKAREKGNSIYEKIFGESPQPLSFTEAQNEEIEIDETTWINKVIDEYTELLIQLSQKQLEFPAIDENEALNELLGENGLLMQAKNSKESQDIIRESLLARVEKEIIDKFGKLPEGLRDFFVENWFNYFCACFQYQLSQKDSALVEKFQSKLLANIEADTTNIIKAFSDFSGEFGERITGIEENLTWLAKEQSEGFAEIKQLFQSAMPLFATIESKDTRKKLVDELKPEFERVIDEIIELKKHFDKRFDRLEKILEQDRNLTPEESEAKEKELIEEYLQTQTDKYTPAEVVGDIYNKDKFFVDREIESVNLREWIANGEKVLVLKGISGNGKTALMTEILQEIAPDASLNHDTVKGILTFYFRDESRQVDFLEICKKADARLERANKNHSFAEQYRNFNRENPTKLPIQIADNLIKELSSLGEVLFVFDNFESALSDRKMVDDEIRAFMQTALKGTNNLRFLLTSQVIPSIEDYKFRDYEIGDLPPNYAKDFLRKKGVELRDVDKVNCGLAEASEDDLNDLLQIIVPSPMTLVSFVGYLETLCMSEGKVFTSVLADGLDDFPVYDADDKNKGARYFITQQYLRLSQIEQLILKALSIFDKAIEFSILKSVLPLSLDVKTILHYLKGNSLVKKVGNNRYELSPLPKDVISNLPDDDISTSRRELHLKAATFYRSIRQPIAECYKQEQFEPYFNAIDHFTEAGFYDGVVSVFYEAMERFLDMGKMEEMIKRCNVIVGKLSKTEQEADNFMNLGLALDRLGRLKEAIIEYDKAIKILKPLVEAGRDELANNLALVYMNKGTSLKYLGKSKEAIVQHDKAIKILERLVENESYEIRQNLAKAYASKGAALETLNNFKEAIVEHDKAIKILQSLIEFGQDELNIILASAYVNKGVSLNKLGELKDSIAEYDKAIEIFEPLFKGGQKELIDKLVSAYVNKGRALDNLEDFKGAILQYNKSIKILEPLVENGRNELSDGLAIIYLNKGGSLGNLGRFIEAIDEYNKAINIRKPLVDGGRSELANDLAKIYSNKGGSLCELGKFEDSIIEFDKAIEIRKPLVEQGRVELVDDLAMVNMKKGISLVKLGKLKEAVEIYSDAIKLWKSSLQDNNLHLLPNLIKAFRIRIEISIRLNDWKTIASDLEKSFVLSLSAFKVKDYSKYFRKLISEDVNEMLRMVRNISPENREEIYKNTGEAGDVIRQYVEDFEKRLQDLGE